MVGMESCVACPWPRTVPANCLHLWRRSSNGACKKQQQQQSNTIHRPFLGEFRHALLLPSPKLSTKHSFHGARNCSTRNHYLRFHSPRASLPYGFWKGAAAFCARVSKLPRMLRNLAYAKGLLLLRALAFAGTLFLVSVLTLYGQATAQSYIEKQILPPVASILGASLGRRVDLGKIQTISPLGLRLGSCSVGPHSEEFSCAELPTVEIRFRPLLSIFRRRVVVQAILMHPSILVCQKRDWTWLGIPKVTDKSYHLSSSEAGIDQRTKARRISREQLASELAAERDTAACQWAKSGYILKNCKKEESSGNHFMTIIGKGSGTYAPNHVYAEQTAQTVSEPEKPPAVHTIGGDFLYWESEGVKNHEEHNISTQGEDGLDEKVVGRSLMDCKVWITDHVVKPFRNCQHRSVKHESRREEIQRRILDSSAVVARAYFDTKNCERCEPGTGCSSDNFKPSAEQHLIGFAACNQEENNFNRVNKDAVNVLTPSPGASILDGTMQEEQVTNTEEDNRELNGKTDDCIELKMLDVHEELKGNGRVKVIDANSSLSIRQEGRRETSPTVHCDLRNDSCCADVESLICETSKEEIQDYCTGSSSVLQEIKVSPQDTERHDFQYNNCDGSYKEPLSSSLNFQGFFGGMDSHAGRGIGASSSNQLQPHKSTTVTPSLSPGNVSPMEAGIRNDTRGSHSVVSWQSARKLASLHRFHPRLEKGLWPLRPTSKWWDSLGENKYLDDHNGQSRSNVILGIKQAGRDIKGKAQSLTNKLVTHAKSKLSLPSLEKWVPFALDSVYFKDGTLMLLAYGDQEPRVMENANGHVKLGKEYEQVNMQMCGRLRKWQTQESSGDGGKLLVKVHIDICQQNWHVKLSGSNLYAPLFERLLEIPVSWSTGTAHGQLHLWASKGDQFPNLAGRLSVNNLGFQILGAPSPFKEVNGTLFFQGQRMFLHNTTGSFGDAPLNVSGDMDLNPEFGEYRLVCQVPNVEINVLMKTLRVRPPIFSLAGVIKAAVYCRGPLEAPVFAGSGEISKKHVSFCFDTDPSAATETMRHNEANGAVAAFDRVPLSYASANFTFDTDNCVLDLYGIRSTLVDGGEIRGAGNMWICPEGEMDPSAINVDLSGQAFFDKLIQNYLPKDYQMPSIHLDLVHGEAKVRGSLLRPIFDIKWIAPEAKLSFSGARGDINVSHEAIVINASGLTFDLTSKMQCVYPPVPESERSAKPLKPALPPVIEGLELDVRMRGFDFLTLATRNSLITAPSTGDMHMKVTGRARFQGRIEKLLKQSLSNSLTKRKIQGTVQEKANVSGFVGEISLSTLRLNQFLFAPYLAGSMDLFPTYFKLHATGRADEHVHVEWSGDMRLTGSGEVPMMNNTLRDSKKSMIHFSLDRGQLHIFMHHLPNESAKLEVRNLQLDELELASLRGTIQKADMLLNFRKRRGQGSLCVWKPRFSGVQGESLDIACKWSGDVITLEKSVLEQASSHYELQGEYVLPGPRDHPRNEGKDDGMWKSPIAEQLAHFIASMGRWRLRLEVPRAEVADMLPVARLLLRSGDPSVVSRSKELFMEGMQCVGYCAETFRVQLENMRKSKIYPTTEEGSPEAIPLPGLGELRGHWHGTFDASGGGNSDTTADFDFYGEEWEWGSYRSQRVIAVGSYDNNEGLRLEKIFIQKDTATLHADGTVLGPTTNLHFAVLNFPIGLLPPLLHAAQSSTWQLVHSPSVWAPLTSIKGILYMEGDIRGPLVKPQCDVQVRLLDGAIGGVELGRAEVAASITSSNRFVFNANFEPVVRSGHVHVKGSLPMARQGIDATEEEETQRETVNISRSRGWIRDKTKGSEESDIDERKLVRDRLGDENWDMSLAETLSSLDSYSTDEGALQVDATVKDGGMMLITALSPYLRWLQGSADLALQVRGTADQPSINGVASFHRVYISSPVLPRPLYNFGGTVRVKNNQLCVEGLDGRVGRKGRLQVKGMLPLKATGSSAADNIEMKASFLEVRAKNVFSGQVDSQIQLTSSLFEPEVSGIIKLSHGEVYLSQEKGTNAAASALASRLHGVVNAGNVTPFRTSESTSLPELLLDSPAEERVEEKGEQAKTLSRIQLRNLKLEVGPELRIVYPLILNFAVSGELEMNGLADPYLVKPKGVLNFENGDVNLVATQVRLSKDHANKAKFDPEQGLNPTLDLVLVGADWKLKVQGPARNWQDNLLITSIRSGNTDALTRTEAARVFESQLAGSLLEGDGQLAFKKLAAATVETLMPKIEGKGEFGQARWRLVSAPQIPNLLSLDPTTDPFKSLANLSFGTEVELQLGKRLQASVVRQMKESEMATQWTLIYQLNNRLRILFQSIPSIDNRILVEYSATSQN